MKIEEFIEKLVEHPYGDTIDTLLYFHDELDAECRMLLFGIDVPTIRAETPEQLDSMLAQLEADMFDMDMDYSDYEGELSEPQFECRQLLISAAIMSAFYALAEVTSNHKWYTDEVKGSFAHWFRNTDLLDLINKILVDK